MNEESHRRAIRESIDVTRECVEMGVENRQRTVGFHCSLAAADVKS